LFLALARRIAPGRIVPISWWPVPHCVPRKYSGPRIFSLCVRSLCPEVDHIEAWKIDFLGCTLYPTSYPVPSVPNHFVQRGFILANRAPTRQYLFSKRAELPKPTRRRKYSDPLLSKTSFRSRHASGIHHEGYCLDLLAPQDLRAEKRVLISRPGAIFGPNGIGGYACLLKQVPHNNNSRLTASATNPSGDQDWNSRKMLVNPGSMLTSPISFIIRQRVRPLEIGRLHCR